MVQSDFLKLTSPIINKNSKSVWAQYTIKSQNREQYIKNLNKNVFVEVIGNKNNVNHLSKIISTISYEILTSLGKRYQRRYIA